MDTAITLWTHDAHPFRTQHSDVNIAIGVMSTHRHLSVPQLDPSTVCMNRLTPTVWVTISEVEEQIHIVSVRCCALSIDCSCLMVQNTLCAVHHRLAAVPHTLYLCL